MNKKDIRLIVYSAMFLAMGLVLPFFTGQIREIGNMLLPMHFTVLLCGFVCGAARSAAVGFIMPLLRSLLFGMPVMYPNAFAMAFELAAYGLIVGALYSLFKKKGLLAAYVSLVVAQLGGRAVWGIVQALILGFAGKPYSFAVFFASAFVNSAPGIILQLVFIPTFIYLINVLKVRKYND